MCLSAWDFRQQPLALVQPWYIPVGWAKKRNRCEVDCDGARGIFRPLQRLSATCTTTMQDMSEVLAGPMQPRRLISCALLPPQARPLRTGELAHPIPYTALPLPPLPFVALATHDELIALHLRRNNPQRTTLP
ncbi:hypothetical protein CIB48_g4142 [Xylaria polymorpha]|nr:hypothetical protein CIB48_g4142 [Xylaria polymorpha]